MAIDRDQAARPGTDNEAMGSPDPSSGIRRRLAVRAAVAFGLVGLAWVAATDLFILGFHPEEWSGSWGRSLNRAVYVTVATLVVYLLVRSLERRSERAEASVRDAGAALARSEERYRSLVERVPGVVWLNEVDRDDPSQTRCVYIAPQVRDLLGRSPEEWIADPDLWERVIHPDDRSGVVALNDRADDTGSLSMEYRAIHRDGRVVWIHDEAVLLPSDGDRPAYWQGVMVDITPQRVADQGVHELAASLRAVFAASPVAIVVLELDGRVRHWNPAAERTFGWSSGEVVGQPLPYVPEDARREFDDVFERARSGGGVATFETERLHKQGHRVSVAVSTAPLLDPDGAVGGVLSVLEDVTERTRIAFELEMQAEMLANVTDAVIGSDEEFRIIYWSPGAELVYGWSAAEAIGRDDAELLRPEPAAPDVGDVRRSFMEHGFWQGELEHRRKDGSRVFVDSHAVARFRGDGSRYFLSVNRDVNERHAAEEALARRARQQEVVDQLALVALEDSDLDLVLREACALVASTLGVADVSVLEALPDRTELVLRARVAETDAPGGEPAARSRIVLDPRSLDAHALDAEASVVVDDFRTDWRFGPDAVDSGIVSGVACVVAGTTRPFGVLKALADRPQAFRHDDVRFLEGISAIVGLAIERDAASSALHRAEERYRVLVEAGPGVVYIHDPDQAPARLRYVSPQVVDLLGYDREDWVADPMFWTTTIHPDDLPRLLRADEVAMANQSAMEIEYRMVHRDGRELWVQDRAEFVRDDAGAPLFRQGLIVDVTERRRAEEERRLALEGKVRLAARLELLHQIDRDVLSGATTDEIAGRALDHLRRLIPFDRGSVATLDGGSGRFSYLAVRQAPDFEEPVPNLASQVPDEVTRRILATDLLIPDLRELDAKTAYTAGAEKLGLRSAVVVALRADDEQIGVLVLVSKRAGAFDEEAFDIAKEAGAELAIAIRQTQLRQALARRAEELGRLADERRQMLHRIVRAQEEERERVALELHDGLGQMLTSISLFAADLEQDVPDAAKARAVRVNELVRRAIVDGRQLVWSLRPPELERLGLVAALRRLCEEVSTPDLTIDLHEQIGDLRLRPETEAVVYRVVQEAVHNAQKHADASSVSILLQRLDGTVTTIVEDNGSGFDAMAVPAGRGLGLIGMRERAELVSGALVVESSAESGTRVRLEVPFESSSGRGGNDS